MRTATLAKLSLTAAVGLGALVGQSTIASAGVTPKGGTIQIAPHPNVDPGGSIKVGPVTTSTTMKPLGGVVVDPPPDPPFNPDLPLAVDDDCTGPACDVAPTPDPCTKVLGCDDLDLGTDPGCTFTHGCPDPSCEDDPDQPQCNVTSNGGTTDGGSTDGTTGNTDGQGTSGGDGQGSTGGTTGDHGSRLPHTGVDAGLMATLGLGLAGTGVVLKRLGRRDESSES